MNIAVREADLEADRELLIDTLFKYLTPQSNASRFDWLYKNNPCGKARAWLAVDSGDRSVVGLAGAFPRRINIWGQEEFGWVLGDFCIHPEYRSMGPALQLQRACLAEVASGKIALCYDFPSMSMMSIYKRLGIRSSGRMLRLAKLLRVDRKIEEIVKVPVLSRGLSAIGNLLLKPGSRKRDTNGAFTVSLHEQACGEEFSELARAVDDRLGPCIRRSAKYLNWRYLASPLCRYQFLTARREGVLSAYAVFTQTGADATLVDLFGVDDPAVIGGLVDHLVAFLRERVVTLSAPMFESHPWISLFYDLGFRERESCPVVVYFSPAFAEGRKIENLHWFFEEGDRDI